MKPLSSAAEKLLVGALSAYKRRISPLAYERHRRALERRGLIDRVGALTDAGHKYIATVIAVRGAEQGGSQASDDSAASPHNNQSER